MAGVGVRLALAGALGCVLAGCASVADRTASVEDFDRGSITVPAKPLQCVPYARQRSGISIFGDAYTWWDKASGRFERGTTPKPGAVIVLAGYAGPNRAHVAVVREVRDSRQISVDHANWLDDGAIYENDPVQDVSADNDWSRVRVWNMRVSAWGTRVYGVQGFIGPGPDSNPDAPKDAKPGSNHPDLVADLIDRDARDSKDN